LEDGTSEEVTKEAEKIEKEQNKELNKAMEASIKAAEEINGKDHNSLTEKLTLPEPMPYLTEGVDLHEGALAAAALSFAKSTLLPILIQTASQILIEKVIEYMDKHNIKVEDGDVKTALTKLVQDALQQSFESAAKRPEVQAEELEEGLIGDMISGAVTTAVNAINNKFGESFIEDIASGAKKLSGEEFDDINEGLFSQVTQLGTIGPVSAGATGSLFE